MIILKAVENGEGINLAESPACDYTGGGFERQNRKSDEIARTDLLKFILDALRFERDNSILQILSNITAVIIKETLPY